MEVLESGKKSQRKRVQRGIQNQSILIDGRGRPGSVSGKCLISLTKELITRIETVEEYCHSFFSNALVIGLTLVITSMILTREFLAQILAIKQKIYYESSALRKSLCRLVYDSPGGVTGLVVTEVCCISSQVLKRERNQFN